MYKLFIPNHKQRRLALDEGYVVKSEPDTNGQYVRWYVETETAQEIFTLIDVVGASALYKIEDGVYGLSYF